MLHMKPPRTPSDALRAAFIILQGIGGHAEHVWECSKFYEDFPERLAYLTRSIAWLKAKTQEKTWRVPPVDFETFCNAPRLLNKNGSLWKAVLAEGRKLNNGHYVEALLTGGIGAAVHGGENVAQIFVGNGRGVHGAGNAGMGIEDSLAHGQTTPLIGQLRTVAESRRCL